MNGMKGWCQSLRAAEKTTILEAFKKSLDECKTSDAVTALVDTFATGNDFKKLKSHRSVGSGDTASITAYKQLIEKKESELKNTTNDTLPALK